MDTDGARLARHRRRAGRGCGRDTHARAAATGRVDAPVAWATAAIVALLVVGAMGALLVMPATSGVVIDATVADGSWTSPGGRTGRPRGSPRRSSDRVASRSGRLVVDVEGAVARPGLVSVPSGGRVGDAIELAGGFAANADLAAAAGSLNLAQEVTDGLKVVVPTIGEATQARAGRRVISGRIGWPDRPQPRDGGAARQPARGRPGDHRQDRRGPGCRHPFATVDELRSRGIVGDATFGKLRDLVAVGR